MREKSPILLLAAAAAMALPAAAAAQCPADAPVREVLLTISQPEQWDSVLPVRIRRPYDARPSARRSRGRSEWSLPLPQAARLEALDLEPRADGYVAVPTEKPWGEMRGRRCVAHFGFRFEKGWRVQVTSEPANLPVQVIVGNGQVAVARTAFTTEPLPLPAPIKLVVGGLGRGELSERTLPLTIHSHAFTGDKPIRHTVSQIMLRLCGRTTMCNILSTKAIIREIVIHRVES